MNFTTLFLSELQTEAINTRRMLACVPTESLMWKPHEKSMTLGSLAGHIAEIPSWIGLIIEANELNFATMNYKAPTIMNNVDVIRLYESTLKEAIEVLESVKDEALYLENWKLKSSDYVVLEQPKHVVIRSMVLNHIIHHRAQLSVYLRLLDLPIPGMYGPSADDV